MKQKPESQLSIEEITPGTSRDRILGEHNLGAFYLSKTDNIDQTFGIIEVPFVFGNKNLLVTFDKDYIYLLDSNRKTILLKENLQKGYGVY